MAVNEGNKDKKQNNPKKSKMPKNIKIIKVPGMFGNIFFYVFLAFAIFILVNAFSGFDPYSTKISLNNLINEINQEKVQDVTVTGDRITAVFKDGTKVYTDKESGISFDQILKNSNVDTTKIGGQLTVEHPIGLDQILTPILMFGLPILVLYFIIRQMRGQSGEILSFGKSRAKLFDKGQSKITFKDVAGNEEAKKEMMEIVDFLKSPEKYRKLGARIPKGVLLVGPSGVGKTLLAKAIAGEAGVPFFSAAGSEFMEMLVGVGSSRVRDLFKTARERQPSLIFIDEIDAIGRQRGMGIGGGHDEREQTLNQILIEMDGFDTRTDVIVLAATNRPDMLDPALVRPGRFDRKITIPLPDLNDREEIVRIHIRGKPMSSDISIEKIAKKTVGFSGADIENMLNEAAILAARDNRDSISQRDLEEAALKVTLGSERKTIQTEEERKMTAFHEAGHAIVATESPDMDPVYRVSIVARGGSLGHTSFPPERDRYNETKTRLLSIITTSLGGRAAEELVFNELTVGAADDINRATKIARKMVMEFGMSSLGPIAYENKNYGGWLARDFEEGERLSDEMASKVDSEVKKIMDSCYGNAKRIIEEKRELLKKVAERLLEKETIESEEFKELLLS